MSEPVLSAAYKFRCSLLGHSSDVRAVAYANQNLVLSGSRDFTSRIWHISDDTQQATTELVLRGHTNYVSSVAIYTDPVDDNILLFTGSNDKSICAYAPSQTDPIYKLVGHEDTVCSLCVGKDCLLVSGSWDKSVKIWKDKSCILTILGHEAAVWSVLLLNPPVSVSLGPTDFVLVTGSADRHVKVWNIHVDPDSQLANHSLLFTLSGHSDCVRSLAAIDNDHILSASNDASIRAWQLTSRQCVGEFYGHSSFVYSLATQQGAPIFVSSGEDRCVRVWPVPTEDQWGPGKHFEAIQCIPLPCQSVWCVTLTSQLDILAGCSDSSLRVFSRDPSRQASPEEIKLYEEELSHFKIAAPSSAATGDLKKLPGVDALLRPGKYEGHAMVIQQEGRQVCYQWSAIDSRWVEVGDVVGTGASKLPMYNGKEYDFVFSVDISDDTSHLKLPYNRSEDPWVVAQRFIHEHNLPQDYLETITQFIIRNAGPPLDSVPVADVPTDPFTGSDRYVPGSMYKLPSNSSVASYFPSKTFIPIKSISLSPLLVKLESFNQNEPSDQRFSATELDHLRGFTFDCSSEQAVHLTTIILDKLSKWSNDHLFPLLDILRCLVFWPSASALLFSADHWKTIYDCSLSNPCHPSSNCLLVLRLLANALASDAPTCLSETNLAPPPSVLTAFSLVKELDQWIHRASTEAFERKPLQIALATYVHNLSVFAHLVSTSSSLSSQTASIPLLSITPSLCLRIGLHILTMAPDRSAGAVASFHPDAIHTLLIAVGTALLTATHSTSDAEADKASRVRLLASAFSNECAISGNAADEIAASWEKVRSVICFWANTPTCLPKVRECAAALLQLLE